jgi:hypothetical protein
MALPSCHETTVIDTDNRCSNADRYGTGTSDDRPIRSKPVAYRTGASSQSLDFFSFATIAPHDDLFYRSEPKAQRQDHKRMTETDALLFQRDANGSKNMPLAVPWQPWQ